jgi:hypothetical protein
MVYVNVTRFQMPDELTDDKKVESIIEHFNGWVVSALHCTPPSLLSILARSRNILID